MTKLILQIFEVLRVHPILRWTSLIVFTAILVLLTTEQSYKEDISDFLPLENKQQQAFIKNQNTSSARRIFVIFQSSDKACQPAVDMFTQILERADTAHVIDYMYGDDPEVVQNAMKMMYARMPYMLRADDYARIDSLMKAPNYIAHQLENDKQMLMLPSGGLVSLQMQYDPLNLFGPVLERQKPTTQVYSDMLLIDSPYGASETEHNATLISMLQQVCDSIRHQFSDISIRLTGGPVIAVGNAQRIKEDSIISITLAVMLILLFLWLIFRNVRNLMLIVVSIGWGWLFAMGGLTLVHDDVSIIVIGISSVIMGIAVNYPLHLIAHLSHTVNIRSALKEIIMPLVVGNITTVGAFLTLIPLESVALRDLGIFSSMLLVGTIVFVLIWLPHMVCPALKTNSHGLGKICDIQLENNSWIVGLVVVLTVMFVLFGFQASFDADLRNINYMTDEQRQDMQLLNQQSDFSHQPSAIAQWNEWRMTEGKIICRQLKDESVKRGFSDDSFDDFYNMLSTSPAEDTPSLTAAIVNSLSDNFNYIGWTCGFIVFFFLWFSLGSIELALISFLPMAVSWVWILGIMSLLGIQFNVVNIILATFIFGQGDDYTIFMTEGCQYEYAYHRKMLNSFKQSIIISAMIMFIGIGSLIIARHPALRSLAEVTIVGMFIVVFMAWLLPPYCFRRLVYDKNGYERRQPITLWGVFFRNRQNAFKIVADRYRYRGVEISSAVNRRLHYLRKHTETLQHLSSTKVVVDEGWGETAMIVAMLNPESSFVVYMKDNERGIIARNAIDGYLTNLKIETLIE